jgi:hypothetical protein
MAEGERMREIGFSIADDIKQFVDFYADQRLTTASAMAKKGMIAEMRRHPLNEAQLGEYEKTFGGIPSACVPVRARASRDYISLPLNSLKDQESNEEQDIKISYAEGVKMTKAEYSALVGQYGEAVVKVAIEKVAAQQIKTGKAYKSPRGAILQWGIRAALEEAKKSGNVIKREAKPNPVCDVCGKLCERYFGHWKCADHGVREAVE